MAKVTRSAPTKTKPAPAPAPSSLLPTKATVPAAPVIEVPSSPDPSARAIDKKKERKRETPAGLELDGIEMWTPRQKRRLDDECCILASDPLAADEAPAVVPTAAAASYDVAVVAERGKVACRDYPHPRSACAKYPFQSTPHAKHCEQCFCYVCDIAAPCMSWKGHGSHCDAWDKDKKWKTMRMTRKSNASKASSGPPRL